MNLVFITTLFLQKIKQTMTPDQMEEAIIRNLQSNTGKSLNEWMKVAKSIASDNEKELLTILKNDHQLGHFQAKIIIKHMHD
jgi:hypothetical protein